MPVVDSLEPRKIPDISPEILLLSGKELERIAHASKDLKKKPETTNRKAIWEASKKMTDKWANTIAGRTKERLKNAKIREDQNETVKRKVDDLEGRYQELRRKYVLDLAQQRRYLETDRVKKLLSARKYCEALKGRDDQLGAQEEAKHVFDELDQAYDRAILADVDNYHEEEKRKSGAKKIICKKLADHMIKQSEQRRKLKSEQDEERQKTLLLDDLANQYSEEDKINIRKQKEGKRQYLRALNEEILRKKHVEKVLSKMEEAEDKRIKLFDEAKLKMKRMHLEKTSENRRLKEAENTKLSNNLTTKAGNLQKKEMKILQRAIREKEARDNAKEQEKAEARQKALQEIDQHTKQKMAEKEKAKEVYKATRLNEGIQLRDLYENLTKKENAELESRKDAAKYATHIVLHQVVEKQAKESEGAKENMEEYNRHIKGLHEEEETFQKFAKKVIDECDIQGMNTHPLKEAAKPGNECGTGPILYDRGCIRPKYYAVNCAVDLPLIPPWPKRTVEETKMRLGFCHSGDK